MPIKLPFFTMLLLISFASVNAVLFTPALPEIAQYFNISGDVAQHTITWFLLGYAVGQLFYGPIANRFGRKPALYFGIVLQILSSLLCVVAGAVHNYMLLIIGRLLLGLGSGVGLKMAFTLVNETYAPKKASATISYLLLGFAITPGLSIALGGLLTTYYGWLSCFYAGAVYGIILLLLVARLPETAIHLNPNALKIKHLLHEYRLQFKNMYLIRSGLLMGTATCFVYAFSALAPFIAINIFNMSTASYGIANILPSIGMIMGSLVSAYLAKRVSLESLMKQGTFYMLSGVVLMFSLLLMHFPVMIWLFIPMMAVYFGLCFVIANASTVAMTHVNDKAHGSAVMNFLNMGLATAVIFALGWFPVKAVLLPVIYFVLGIFMLVVLNFFKGKDTPSSRALSAG